MAYIQTRQVTIGQLLSGTFSELSRIPRELAIYFAVFAGAALVAELIPLTFPLIAVAAFFGYFGGQYLLYRALLGNAAMTGDQRFKVFSFFGIAAVLSIPITIGMNFFYIPGLLLAAKWVMAPSFLVAEDRDLFQAIGDSWHASSNNLLPLAVAFGIIVTGWTVAFGLGFALAESMLRGVLYAGGGGMIWPFMHMLPVTLMGLSVTAYRELGDNENSLVAVFE